MKVSCVVDGVQFEAKRASAKYCSPKCKKRAYRGTKIRPLEPVPDASESELVASVRSELKDLGVATSSAGRQAIAMAERMSMAVKDTGSSYAAISRELSRLLDEAKAGAIRKADPLDELRDRRERKRASA